MSVIADPSKTLIPTGEPGSDLGSLSTLLPPEIPKLAGGGTGPGEDASDDLKPGTLLLDRYRVQGRIARGGYSDIFRACDEQGPRTLASAAGSLCALKIAHDLYRPEDGASELQHEASILGRLFHPNIVAFQRWHRGQDGREFLVLEFLQGASLADILGRGAQLSVPCALFVIRAVAAALQYAHDHGVIHGDITPSNIFLCGVNDSAGADVGLGQPLHDLPEQVKVLDFGSAHHAQDPTAAKPGEHRLFHPSALAYQAPELCGSGQVAGDVRSDLWALGVLTYRLLAGRLPFDHSNPLHLRLLIRQKDPLPLAGLNRDLPGAVCAAVHRALAKKRDDRPARVRDFVRALDGLPPDTDKVEPQSPAASDPPRTVALAGPVQAPVKPTDSMITPTVVDSSDTIELRSLEEVGVATPPPPPAAALQRRRTLSPTAATLTLPGGVDESLLLDSALPSVPESVPARASPPLPGVISRRNTVQAIPAAADSRTKAPSAASTPSVSDPHGTRSPGSPAARSGPSGGGASGSFAPTGRRSEGALDSDQQTTLQCHRADLIALTREAMPESTGVPSNVSVEVAGRHPQATVSPGATTLRAPLGTPAHSTSHWPGIDTATTNVLPGRAWPVPQPPAPATSISWSSAAAQGAGATDDVAAGNPHLLRAGWVLVGFLGASLFGVILLLATTSRGWLGWLRALLPALVLACLLPATAQARPLDPPASAVGEPAAPWHPPEPSAIPRPAPAQGLPPPVAAALHSNATPPTGELPIPTASGLPPAGPPPARQVHPDVWLGLGAGGLFALGGLVAGAAATAHAADNRPDLQIAMRSSADSVRQYQDAHSLQIVATVLFAASAVSITVSCLLLLRQLRSQAPRVPTLSAPQPAG